jgi:pyruvate dehydrogenase E2 component (dihydrolipoamide acetyltransferase)
MVTKVVMPRLSLTMKEGTIIQWFKKEEEAVEKGEPLVEVLSEKVTYNVEAPASGILKKILVTEGSEAPVNAILAVITAPDEPLPEITTLLETVPTTPITTEIPETKPVKSETSLAERISASPAAKRLAKEHGIDLKNIVGTGPDGRIIEEDVKRFIEENLKWTPKVKQTVPLTGIRKTVAERLSHSFRTAPHSVITMEVDMSNALKLREKHQVSITELLVKIVAEALKQHSLLNSSLQDNEIKIFEDINIGVAVATENGLVVVVLREADKKSINEIASTLRELIEKAKQGKLSKGETTGGTFTISNLGMYGVDLFMPIINPPETAILGVGKIVEKPVAINGEVKVKPLMTLSLAYDHRVVDGVPAAQFLSKIKQILEYENTL